MFPSLLFGTGECCSGGAGRRGVVLYRSAGPVESERYSHRTSIHLSRQITTRIRAELGVMTSLNDQTWGFSPKNIAETSVVIDVYAD